MRRFNVRQEVSALGPLDVRQGEKEVLGRNEFVPQFFCVAFSFVEYLVQLARESRLRIGLLRVARHLAPDCFSQLCDADAELLQDGNDDALVLREQGHEQMQVINERVPGTSREVDCFVQRFGCFYCKAIRIDHRVASK